MKRNKPTFNHELVFRATPCALGFVGIFTLIIGLFHSNLIMVIFSTIMSLFYVLDKRVRILLKSDNLFKKVTVSLVVIFSLSLCLAWFGFYIVSIKWLFIIGGYFYAFFLAKYFYTMR